LGKVTHLSAPNAEIPAIIVPQTRYAWKSRSLSALAPVATAAAASAIVISRRGARRLHRSRAVTVHRAQAKEDGEDGFSDVFATEVFKGGAPILIENGKVRLDAGANAEAEGLEVKWGVFKERVENVDNSEAGVASRAQKRDKAAQELVNIGDEERARRDFAGNVGAVVLVLIVAVLLATSASWQARAAIFPVVALTYGFKLSAQEGL